MDDIFARKKITTGNLGLAGIASAQLHALGKQSRACGLVNGAGNAAAVGQTVVCGVDHGVYLHFCNVIADNLKRHAYILLREKFENDMKARMEDLQEAH